MHFYKQVGKLQTANAMDAFFMPFSPHTEFEDEVCKWKYARLHNKGKTLLSVRCNRFVNGLVERQK